MAIAELTQDAFAAAEAAHDAGKIRLGVHDASRVEWSLSLPLSATETTPYKLRVEIGIPSNAFVRHVPWDQMQAFTRLDGPAVAGLSDVVTIDELRRGALAAAHQLSRASKAFQRHCRLAVSLFATAPHSELEDALSIWIEAAVEMASDARVRLTQPVAGEACELARERELVDEYVSVRLFEMLAGAERALATVRDAKSPHAAQLAPVVVEVETKLANALANELAYRAAHGHGNVDAASPHALERYLERASRLKKHFQEVLFLEPESFKVAERAYHWIAGFVALLASTWAFAWQIALSTQAKTVSSGVIVLAGVAGLIYATKDRFKEIGRSWMTNRVQRVYGAQRITRYRAPLRRLPGRDVVVVARESFDTVVVHQPDPLNPASCVSTVQNVLRYEQKGQVLPSTQLLTSGVRRVKHVFRYDLSPLFARLDDATKPVPVLEGGRVRFVAAPRCYRLPVLVEITCNGQTQTERGTIVMHKRGLERIEKDRAVDSAPALVEGGLEPV